MNKPSEKIRIRSDVRFAGEKSYWTHQLNEFGELVVKGDITYVSFGKEDSRGAPSICIWGASHCPTYQKHFTTNKEMLTFVSGYVMANSPKWDRFKLD